MGDTWREVETCTKTGEPDQGGNRRQRAVRQRFNPRHMKSGMYTEGVGQVEGLRILEMGKGKINRGEGLRDSTLGGRSRVESHTLCPSR